MPLQPPDDARRTLQFRMATGPGPSNIIAAALAIGGEQSRQDFPQAAVGGQGDALGEDFRRTNDRR